MMKAPSKKDRLQALTEKIAIWKSQGINPLDMLTPDQYDFLVDMDFDTDSLCGITAEQKKASQSITRSQRSCSPNGYNKTYPQDKIDTYNGICEYLVANGYEIERPAKENYRDLFLTKNGTRYKIVLSVPR